jgi:hypothetical protein
VSARLRPYRPTHAAVVAYLALFVALGGSSYAAVRLSAHSVGSRELKRAAVTPTKLNPKTLASINSIAYREFDSTVAAGKTDFGVVKCPAKHPHGVSGYFGSEENGVTAQGRLVQVDATPLDPKGRRWEVGVRNLDSAAHGWFGGVVCAR